MCDTDRSLDLTGIGKLAKSIPASSWNKAVKTACDTFEQIIAPITSTTKGLGRLIEAKFDGMIDVQKDLVADTMRRAKEKLEKCGGNVTGRPKASILMRAIETVSNETDENVRDLWANLIANEIQKGSVHPEFPRILERLSPEDALTLVEIAKPTEAKALTNSLSNALRAVIYGMTIKTAFVSISGAEMVDAAELGEGADFHKTHLSNLNLIFYDSGQWRLTAVGKAFLHAVADPSYDSTAKAEQNHPCDPQALCD